MDNASRSAAGAAEPRVMGSDMTRDGAFLASPPNLTAAEWGVAFSELRTNLNRYESQAPDCGSRGNRYGANRAKLAADSVRPIVDKIAKSLLGSAEGQG